MVKINFDVELNEDDKRRVVIKLSGYRVGNMKFGTTLERAREWKDQLDEAIEKAEV